ncbi:archaeal/vacuolar-type h+-ATPase subunit i [Halogeometricum pallidum JCM 14848]|uniref:A-type ATP synthase subunit I n=1 Tax=Halogeometricum pallidum JCM 14848 TaxID=1227487 RepID=M0D8I3_HALPD|nr:V-type ATP synthase subunit I [Halogeometricum pallidum]ELZ30464.1 archaeal/vacuolar-type h+-ATPase subunit i [Halogeometricum pallidum JCM 14848]
MLRPEQMSKVSVTGSKRVMDPVIETVHDLNLLHVTEYDNSWDGFDPGDPAAGAETASDKLVTVRSLESILDVDEEDAGPTRIVTDDALEAELEEIRTRVNELDDERQALRQDLREIEERTEAMEPFEDLGIDLDLLSGYDSIQVAVGRGKREAIERAIVDSDELVDYEIFEGDDALAVFARPASGADDSALTDALVSADFATLEVPDARGSPQEYIRELEHEHQQISSKLESVEDELSSMKLDAAGFLLAAEEKLSIDVQKTEAPLSFATTENAFVSEGWIPTERFTEFKAALKENVGERVEVEELQRATFSRDGTDHVREDPAAGGGGSGKPAAADGGTAADARADGGHASGVSATSSNARSDGGAVVMDDDEPPTIQNNSGPVQPFEVLVQAVSRPSYYEFDPTVILFLTFPAFFGFMIGDLGYGLIYTAIGLFLWSKFDDRPAFKSMGGITIAAGLFTTLFGILYGEIFGLHLVATYFWEGVVGLSHAPIEKGLSPATSEWALGWLTVSVMVGIVHLNIGWLFDFFENLELHDLKHAVYESGSWLLMLNGLWIWIFSDVLRGTSPEFLYTTFSAEGVLPLGFSGFPAIVGWVGLGVFFLGLVLLAVGEPIEVVEFLNVLVNVLSYTRIAAVLLAKAGMAFTVNLLFFGVYATEGEHGNEWHFGLDHMPHVGDMSHGHEVVEVLFPGLVHGGAATVLLGLLVLVLGHLVVLALGVTSAGLQAVRLEYVEFFNKFYEGGGRDYEPFGYDRQFTTED